MSIDPTPTKYKLIPSRDSSFFPSEVISLDPSIWYNPDHIRVGSHRTEQRLNVFLGKVGRRIKQWRENQRRVSYSSFFDYMTTTYFMR